MADFDVDLFVIGAGSGGVRAARIAAGYGARVVIAEEYRVGGTCVIRGCVPKKLLVMAARFGHGFADAAGFGWTVDGAHFDWATLIANKDREIDRLEAAYAGNLERSNVEIIRERAVIAGPHLVELASGNRLRALHILIATGGTPDLGPDIPGRDLALTSNEMFHLPELPKSIVIQGGGFIAVEFATIMEGLGVEVTLVYRGETILRGFDDEVRTHVSGELAARGIRIITGRTITGLFADGKLRRATLDDGEVLTAEAVMFAIGRHPHTRGLGLEAAGVATDAKGAVLVDGYSATSVPGIHAVGDVTNRINLTPVAIREGHALADTLFGGKPTRVDHSDVAQAVFCEPEIGTVGLTEAQAKATLAAVDVYRASFKPMKHTLSGRNTRMLMKLLVDGDTDRVVGCHIVGAEAAEMIQLVAIALKAKLTKAAFDATMALHPCAAEELVTMRSPAERWRRD